MTENLWLSMGGDSVVGHSDSMGRQMAVFQSLTTPGRIMLPSCYDDTKTACTLSFIAIENRAVMTKLAV
jgi:hypothetical protein